jgi:hypothetical protein
MSWLKRIFGAASEWVDPTHSTEALPQYKLQQANELNDLQRNAIEQAYQLMNLINESLQISNNSTNPETKVSRLELARSKLDSLMLLAAQYSFIKLERLDEVRNSIKNLEKSYAEAGYYAQTDQSCRDYRQDVWRGLNVPMSDLAKGWIFNAAIQLRTPLRVLMRHREIHASLTEPPSIAKAQWEGSWAPQIKTYQELGIEDPIFEQLGSELSASATTSSDIGPVPASGGEYLKFLLVLREIVESHQPIEVRRELLRDELRKTQWNDFCIKLGGKQKIVASFFPSFIETIKGLPANAVRALWDLGLTTARKIDAATDSDLKAIKGIGPAKLQAIRAACSIARTPDSEFVDNVTR